MLDPWIFTPTCKTALKIISGIHSTIISWTGAVNNDLFSSSDIYGVTQNARGLNIH